MSNIVIIGSGPAGVSAALYAARAGVQTTVLTKGPGALDRAELIQNYYGFAEPITGAELERRGIEGAKAVGVEFVTTEAVGLTYTDKLTVETLAGDFPADAVILATGASRAAPRIPGLAGLEGHGVSYCAICDAFSTAAGMWPCWAAESTPCTRYRPCCLWPTASPCSRAGPR